jgi:acid stress chaperone HdeB
MEMVPVRSGLLVAMTLCAFVVVPAANAQMTLDVSKITCEQFTRYKISNPENIAIWISGYYAGTRGNTVIDPQAVLVNARKLQDFCFHNQQTAVIDAVEQILGSK